jgi:hypothetical protein
VDTLRLSPAAWSKAFAGPSVPGGTTTLQFSIRNLDRDEALTDVAFTDDLDAVLTGLVAVDTPARDVCGEGSQLDGASILSLRDGRIAASDVCTFEVTLALPDGAPVGDFGNVTSPLVVRGRGVAEPAVATLPSVPPPSPTPDRTAGPTTEARPTAAAPRMAVRTTTQRPMAASPEETTTRGATAAPAATVRPSSGSGSPRSESGRAGTRLGRGRALPSPRDAPDHPPHEPLPPSFGAGPRRSGGA